MRTLCISRTSLAPSVPRTPSKGKGKEKEVESPPSTEKKKSKWRDFDPYKLPEVDMEAAIAKASRASAPDPRLATEDELRYFIDRMKPEDLDVTSPAFRELPTEVQYEIIGDLRLKSRQTSHKRLEAMLKISKSALDFSKAQILNLKQRKRIDAAAAFHNGLDRSGSPHDPRSHRRRKES